MQTHSGWTWAKSGNGEVHTSLIEIIENHRQNYSALTLAKSRLEELYTFLSFELRKTWTQAKSQNREVHASLIGIIENHWQNYSALTLAKSRIEEVYTSMIEIMKDHRQKHSAWTQAISRNGEVFNFLIAIMKKAIEGTQLELGPSHIMKKFTLLWFESWNDEAFSQIAQWRSSHFFDWNHEKPSTEALSLNYGLESLQTILCMWFVSIIVLFFSPWENELDWNWKCWFTNDRHKIIIWSSLVVDTQLYMRFCPSVGLSLKLFIWNQSAISSSGRNEISTSWCKQTVSAQEQSDLYARNVKHGN